VSTRNHPLIFDFPVFLNKSFCVRLNRWPWLLVVLLSFSPRAWTAESASSFLWARQLGDNGGNEALGLAVDKSGNVFVTGFFGLKRHELIGTHGWSISGGEIFLAKYAPNGKLLWLQKAGGSGTDAGIAVAADEAGNAFVTGYFAGTVRFGAIKLQASETAQSRGRAPADMFVAKYDPRGKVLWAQQAGGERLDQGYGVATDGEGNVYVTGYFQGKAKFGGMELTGKTHGDADHEFDTRYGDMFLAKYSGTGKLLWLRQAGDRDKNAGNSVTVDSAGHVYVTGQFGGGTIHFDEVEVADTNLCNFIVKYDRDGKVVWAQPTAGPRSYGGGGGNTVAVDREDRVFVAGNFELSQQLGGNLLQQDRGMNEEIFLLKYNPDGSVLWGRQAGGSPRHEYCSGLALDRAGNAFITGSFDDAADFGSIHAEAGPHNPGITGTSVYVAKYTASGEPVWVKAAGPAPTEQANGYGPPRAIAADQGGNLYVGGSFRHAVTFGATTLRETKDMLGNTGGNGFVAKLGQTRER